MSTSAAQSWPLHEIRFDFPVSDDGSIDLDEAPTADLVRLASAVLAVVAERRSQGQSP